MVRIETVSAVNGKYRENSDLGFNQYYKDYYTVIYKHTSYLTGNIQAAEDITQEVFIKLYNNPPKHSNVIAWLSKIASNLSYNYLRDEKRKKGKEKVLLEDNKIISIEDAAIKNQEIRLIRKILDGLPERDRICLLLKFSGYKYNEISEIIGVEKSSVGTILARSQKKFMVKYNGGI